ncbi:hypothetical protein LINPERPRIM_LOCUS1650 [Linum perenne]
MSAPSKSSCAASSAKWATVKASSGCLSTSTSERGSLGNVGGRQDWFVSLVWLYTWNLVWTETIL